MNPGNTIIMLSRNIKAGQYNWQPKNMEEAKALIAHLQETIRNKDKRIIALVDMERASQRENDILFERIAGLKKFLRDIGLKTI